MSIFKLNIGISEGKFRCENSRLTSFSRLILGVIWALKILISIFFLIDTDFITFAYIMNVEATIIEIENRLIENSVLNLQSNTSSSVNNCVVNAVAHQIHHQVITSLIKRYLNGISDLDCDEILKMYFMSSMPIDISQVDLNIIEIPSLCESLHIKFLNSLFEEKNARIFRKKSKQNFIEKGAVYTQNHICTDMVREAISLFLANNDKPISDIKILDFAAGSGRFYQSVINILHTEYGIAKNTIITDNLFALDIDPIAVDILRLRAISQTDNINERVLLCIKENIICRNALISKSLFRDDDSFLDENKDFNDLCKIGFDIVVSNPPYLVLKVNNASESVATATLQQRVKSQISYFKSCGLYNYSIEGMLNYYQLSIERILAITHNKGQVAIICPSSLFADVSSSKLRKHLVNGHKIQSIIYYPESVRLFENVSQATNIFFLQKNGITSNIQIEINKKRFQISVDDIKTFFSDNFEIPLIAEIGWKVLSKLFHFKKLKTYPDVRNRRGELDLTLFKNCITDANTGYRLVRGNMIKSDGIIYTNKEFVEIDNFISRKSFDYINRDFKKKRLVGPQISNIDSLRRLKFVYCDENDIIGNSCNYISSTSTHTLRKLYILLNSKLLNWRFKVTSSNNHINNYEIDELPILNLDEFNIDSLSQDVNLDCYICQAYGLDKTETEYILNLQNETI